MMNITRGGESRQSWLAGYSDLSVDRFIIEVCLSLDGRCQGVIATVFFCSFHLDRQQVRRVSASWSPATPAAIARRQQKDSSEATNNVD